MLGRNKQQPATVRKVYFQERRGKGELKYYSGTVIGTRGVIRTKSNIFGGEVTKWQDTALLIETSDHRKVSAYELDTFEVKP